MRNPLDLCFDMKNFLKFGGWLLVVLVMLFLGGCATPDSAITKAYEIDMKTETGSNVVILVLDADVESSTAVKQEAKADARTQVDATLSPAGKIGEAAAVAGDLLEAGKRLPVVPKEEVVPPVEESSAGGTTEDGTYWGRHNGDRATWYFAENMTAYPDIVYLTVDGCASGLKVKTGEVDDKGNPRFVIDGYIVKQSDVSGRGLTVVAPSSCLSKKASIAY